MKATGIICMVLLTSAATPTIKENEWTLTKSKDGINAFVGKPVNSAITPTRAEMSVALGPEKVVHVIADLNNYSKWIPYCNKSYTIQRVSDTVSYGYQRISAPMVTDRDVAVRLCIHKISDKNYEVVITAVPNFVKPESNAIRIQHLFAYYHIYAGADNLTHIEQVNEVDIGGSIPSFLLNWSNRNQPAETFANLRKEILNS